jgi:toxin-antitoxin system PIN domain toxin
MECLVGVLRLTTRASFFKNPLNTNQAIDLVEMWLAEPGVSILEPGPRHLDILRSLLIHAGTAGNLTSDAHLAAIAIEHDGEVHSVDLDFARFPGLRWVNPLAG